MNASFKDNGAASHLVKALKIAEEYFQHKAHCSINLPDENPGSDFCDCAYREAIEKIQTQILLASAIESKYESG